jgi:NAD-dependent deacetylase
LVARYVLDMKKIKIVALTGAGISAESGLKTFRDSDGLWEGYNVHDVATPEAWHKDPVLVQDFYNMRRKNVLEAVPNEAHKILAELDKQFDVTVITQNIDDLHERARSQKVVHLHGEITKSQSTLYSDLIYTIDGWELKMGDVCEKGAQLRPFIVWFGEAVPKMDEAIDITLQADVFVVIGTSLAVYPAAGLLNYVKPETPVYIIDPGTPAFTNRENITFIQEKATTGMKKLLAAIAS